MPFVTVNNVSLYYEIHGEGDETILFSHGLLLNSRMFHQQINYFKSRYRCVAFDHRGQGQSEITEDGYDMDTLTEDALQLMNVLQLGSCHIAGLSMGGFVAMRLAARHPELVKSLVLLETSADEEPNVFKYRLLTIVYQFFGAAPIAKRIMKIMFGKKFLNNPNRQHERNEWRKVIEDNPRTIVRAVEGVIERKPIFDELKNITAPTLVMVGDQDVATVPAKSERIHSQIPNAQLVILKGAGHSSTIEEPDQVNGAIDEFLRDLQTEYDVE